MYNHHEPCRTSVSIWVPFMIRRCTPKDLKSPVSLPWHSQLSPTLGHPVPLSSLSLGHRLQCSPAMNSSKVQWDARKWEFHEEHHILSGLLWNAECWQNWQLVFMRDPYCWLHTLLYKLNRKSCPSRFSCPFSNTAHFKSCNVPLSGLSAAEHYGCSEENRSPTTCLRSFKANLCKVEVTKENFTVGLFLMFTGNRWRG